MMPARWTWAGVWFTPVVAVTATAAVSPDAAAIRTAATHSRTRRVMATSFARCDLRCEIIGGSALRRRRIGVASPGRARARQQAGADLRQGRQRTGTASPALGRNPAAAARWYGPRIMGTGIYLWHGQFLSRDRACRALGELFGCAPSPGALASAAKKTAGLIAPRAGRDHPVPRQRGGRALRRDRVPHRGEARLGALRLVGEVRAGHRACQAREGRDDGRRGAAALHRH